MSVRACKCVRMGVHLSRKRRLLADLSDARTSEGICLTAADMHQGFEFRLLPRGAFVAPSNCVTNSVRTRVVTARMKVEPPSRLRIVMQLRRRWRGGLGRDSLRKLLERLLSVGSRFAVIRPMRSLLFELQSITMIDIPNLPLVLSARAVSCPNPSRVLHLQICLCQRAISHFFQTEHIRL